MKLIFALLALLVCAARLSSQQSLSLVSVAPVQCIVGQTCAYPHTLVNQTGIAIIRLGPVSIKDSRGNHWTRDFCMTYTADCFYHAYFTETTNPGDQIFYTPYNGGGSAVLLMYPGKYDFAGGSVGDYNLQNSAFPDCINGQDCQYSWTLPIDTEPGDLEICFAEQNAIGHGIPRPGWGFQVEFNNQLPDQAAVAVLDKISPGGVEFCSLEWAGPSHWLAGLAIYRKETQSIWTNSSGTTGSAPLVTGPVFWPACTRVDVWMDESAKDLTQAPTINDPNASATLFITPPKESSNCTEWVWH